ncbi:MAG: M23 family metallopeptidase [Candidatus Gracilibacteria bacterium]|nr:M23 family metallopeptidase [Candidatus Gracilibacteria bacterium]
MKKIFTSIFLIIGLSIALFGYSFYNYLGGTRLLYNEVFSDAEKNNLNENYYFIKANRELRDLELKSNCNIKSQYVGEKNGLNIFHFKLLDKGNTCKDFRVFLSYNNKQVSNTQKRLEIKIKADIIEFYSDFSDNDLALQIASFEHKLEDLKQEKLSDNVFIKLVNSREQEKNKYYIDLLNYIKQGRKNKYLIPTPGYDMPTQATRLPNAGRSYRESYTDSFHHGWDFYAPLRSNVVSLDDGVVIRVVKNFQFSDLEKINYSHNLPLNDRMLNLDILRGNQVWIKTLKGEVALYSHLSKSFDNIKEGTFISRGYPVGQIGITGVPDANYSNYHLHLPIQKNPYNSEKYGKYSYLDIMKWDWLFRGETINYIRENQYSIFSKK